MRQYYYFVLIVSIIILSSSCRKDFEYGSSAGNLEFSKDTVYLDTVFSTIGSSTHTLKVYNRTRDDVKIPSIRLGQGQNSNYRLNVDGVAGKEFEDIRILAQDSMFIFIETTVEITDTAENDFLYTDVIQFDASADLQEVQLVTLVKDAIFLFPKELSDEGKETIQFGLDASGNDIFVEGFELKNDQLNFTNQKPYVIYGYASVTAGKQLSIDAGARVHFHKDSGILINANASLQVNGSLSSNQELLEHEVIFSGDRLQSELSNIPGQWGAIWISSGSNNNVVDHLTIKNATVGLLVEGNEISESPTLTIKNSQIYNSASSNLWAQTAHINAENLVLGSSGNASLFLNLGGNYLFTHCTIANYWSNGFRDAAALEIDNFSALLAADLEKATFTNCIIDGNNSRELALRSNENNAFEFNFTNCLLKFRENNNATESDQIYDFENTTRYSNLFLNPSINFMNANQNIFKLQSPSDAEEKADLDAASDIPFDILGIDRTLSPSVGAYQISQ